MRLGHLIDIVICNIFRKYIAEFGGLDPKYGPLFFRAFKTTLMKFVVFYSFEGVY